jgi:hypothetical protein
MMRFFLILILSSIVLSQLVEAEDYDINLNISQTPIFNITPSIISETIDEGSSRIVNIEVSNIGNADLNNVTVYNLSESDSIYDWITFSNNSLETIIPLELKEFNVTISVPSGTSGGTYNSEIIVGSNETENATIQLEITVPGVGTTSTSDGNGNGNGGNGGNGGVGGDGTTTSTTTTVIVTTQETTTTEETTTSIACLSTGEACSSDSECCSGFCCDEICSDTECKMKAQFNYMSLLFLVVIGGSATTGYYVYKKYYKKKTAVKIKPQIPTAAPVKKELRIKLLEELDSLRIISEQLKTQGHDVREIQNEIALSYNALNKGLPKLAVSHMNKGLNKAKQLTSKQ